MMSAMSTSGSSSGSLDGECVLVDLDGVIWRGDDAIPGAAGGVAELRRAGARVAFFTNNSFTPVEGQLAKLARTGIPAQPGDVLTSSQAAAGLVQPGEAVLAVGGPGLLEALAGRGAAPVEIGRLAGDGRRAGGETDLGPLLLELASGPLPEVTSVLVGIDPGFDYRRLAIATRAVRGGARLIATNADATFPTPLGLVPGAGAGLAAIAVASGVSPVVAGKPHEAAAKLAKERLGDVSIVIGDRPDTDGAFAERLGARFALVLTGVTPPGHGPVDPAPALEAPDLALLAGRLLGGDGRA
jgi:HAD superfamily hydrolase (TIGR01450 family)